MLPKMGALWKKTPISKALLNIPFRAPSKRAVLPGSPHRAPADRDAPFPEPSICLSKSLVNEPPSRFSKRAPVARPIARASLYMSFSLQ